MNYITRITRLTVLPKGEPIFSEQATNISIDDEAAGEFVVVEQIGGNDPKEGRIRIDPKEWLSIRAAIERLMGEIK